MLVYCRQKLWFGCFGVPQTFCSCLWDFLDGWQQNSSKWDRGKQKTHHTLCSNQHLIQQFLYRYLLFNWWKMNDQNTQKLKELHEFPVLRNGFHWLTDLGPAGFDSLLAIGGWGASGFRANHWGIRFFKEIYALPTSENWGWFIYPALSVLLFGKFRDAHGYPLPSLIFLDWPRMGMPRNSPKRIVFSV